MAIRPTDGKDLVRVPSSNSGTGKPVRKQAARDDGAERESRQIREHMDQQREYFRDAEVQLSKRYEQLRDEYADRTDVELARQEAALEAQHVKGYEAVRDLKRSQDFQLGRMKAEGDKRVEEMKEHYRSALRKAESEGIRDLKELQRLHSNQVTQEQKAGSEALTEMKTTTAQRLDHQQQDRDLKVEQATQAYQKEYTRMKANTQEAMETAQTRFQERFDHTLDAQKDTFERINSKAASSLNNLRQNHADKLAAYDSRSEDPFYRIVDLGPDLEDTGDAFVLRVSVPEYEQENVKVSFRGNETLVLSGYRRNEDKLELESGRVKRTAAFQSFSETLPLPSPVDAKRMTREYDGGELVVNIPKLGPTAAKKIYQGQKPERSRVERPDFPKGLAANNDSAPKESKKDPTLS